MYSTWSAVNPTFRCHYDRGVDISRHFPRTHALFPVPDVPDDCLQAIVLFAFGADPIRLTMPKALFQKRAQGIFVGPEY
jgi:hypothetical protein